MKTLISGTIREGFFLFVRSDEKNKEIFQRILVPYLRLWYLWHGIILPPCCRNASIYTLDLTGGLRLQCIFPEGQTMKLRTAVTRPSRKNVSTCYSSSQSLLGPP